MKALILLAALASAEGGYEKLPKNACPGRGQFRDDHFQALAPLPQCPASEQASIFARLIRGGAPTKDGLRCLKEQGVAAVIDLRSRGEDGQKKEELLAAELGLAYFNFPMTTYGGLETCEKNAEEKTEKNRTATEQAIEKIKEIMKSSPAARIYIHCAHGQDRTGLLFGLLRLELERCSPPTAREEMLRYKYSPYCSLERVWEEGARLIPNPGEKP